MRRAILPEPFELEIAFQTVGGKSLTRFTIAEISD
jgi:hypothetical protein